MSAIETGESAVAGAVLLADPALESRQEIGEALTQRGFSVRYADDGAEALEASLTEVPDVILMAPELGVIDPPTLAALLRANPRTQRTRRVLLGPLPEEAAAFDDSFEPASGEGALADWLASQMATDARPEASWGPPESPSEVEGQLSQIALTDLLELFHANRRTGRVELTRPGGGGREEFGTVWLRDGQPLEAKVGPVDGEKALFRLLTWSQGQFAFSPEEVVVVPRIQTPLRGLLMEAMRQFDEWERQRSELPPLEGRVKLRVARDELPNVVQPITQEVLLLLDLYSRVRDVVDHCGHPDYQVLRTLQALVDRELVELLRDPYGSTKPELGAAVLGHEELSRLEAWLREGERQHRGKLVVAAASPEVLGDFLNVATLLPGASLSEELDGGAAAVWERLAPLGSLKLERDLEIELWHLPIDDGYRSVWSLVTWGALGALLVSRRGGGVSALEPLCDALLAAGTIRLFHLSLVDEKDAEKDAAETDGAEPAALDGTQAVALPIETQPELEHELNVLIHRLVP
jgi:hypothetical protein